MRFLVLALGAALMVAACSPSFTAIKQRCAATPNPSACEDQGYEEFYVAERAKLRRVGGN